MTDLLSPPTLQAGPQAIDFASVQASPSQIGFRAWGFGVRGLGFRVGLTLSAQLQNGFRLLGFAELS